MVLAIADIDWVEAQDYCVLVHVGKMSYLLRDSIRRLDELLTAEPQRTRRHGGPRRTATANRNCEPQPRTATANRTCWNAETAEAQRNAEDRPGRAPALSDGSSAGRTSVGIGGDGPGRPLPR